MIKINGSEYRNLPQQVAKNANDIDELKKAKTLYRHYLSGGTSAKLGSGSTIYQATFVFDTISNIDSDGDGLDDLIAILKDMGYNNAPVTTETPSSEIVQYYGFRTNLSLRQGSINPGYQYPCSVLVYNDVIYVTMNTNDSTYGEGKVFHFVDTLFSMKHVVKKIVF